LPIKKASLETLYKLQMKSDLNPIAALDPKSIIPFLYTCLGSPKPEIRQISREFIANYGAKAELALIEGFTKDENEIVRSECVRA
jgi:HEAT repeat protein